MNTITETEKVLAAMDQAEESPFSENKYSDIQRVKAILPKSYEVEKIKAQNAIHCKSITGIKQGIDAEDNEHWSYVMQAFKKYFGYRFKEVYHNVCFCHTDFIIYLNAR